MLKVTRVEDLPKAKPLWDDLKVGDLFRWEGYAKDWIGLKTGRDNGLWWPHSESSSTKPIVIYNPNRTAFVEVLDGVLTVMG